MNILIFGVGPHATRIHLNFFKKNAYIKKIVVVDLKGQEERLKTALETYGLDYELVLIDPNEKNSNDVPENIKEILRTKIKEYGINHAVIETEPKAHKMYIEFCLQEGLNLLCDKPLTTPVFPNTVQGANTLQNDFDEIIEKFHNSSSKRFDLMTQRRSHEGFLKVYEIVNEVVQKYGVPITKMKIFHQDGNWPMPNEVIKRENHPYKYGYGKLMHSGFHFVDLVSMFMNINHTAGLDYEKRDVQVMDYRHSDFMTYFNQEFYNKLDGSFGYNEDNEIFDHVDVFENFGTLDVSSMINYMNKNGRVMTQAILDLAQASFSKRAWFEEPADTYKGNGRLRHEYLEINVGPLLNVKILSFQSREIHEEKEMKNEIGALDHFEVDVFRNNALIGGKPFERFLIEPKEAEDGYLGQNEQAKFDVLDKFFLDKESLNSIELERETISLITEMYKQMSTRYPDRSYYKVNVTDIDTRHVVVSETITETDSIETAIKRGLTNKTSSTDYKLTANGYHFDNDILVYDYNIKLK